ncbi:MAG: hypothetical protein WCP93_03590 [Candidatus Berkelbacteria bacterium]
MSVVKEHVILVPLVVFNTPAEPFYQHLHIGKHVGNVELRMFIGIPREFIKPAIGNVQMLSRPHEIWLSQKKNHTTRQEDMEMLEMLKNCDMGEKVLDDLMRSKEVWALRCFGDPDETCKCAHDPDTKTRICKCFDSIIHTNHHENFSSAIAMVGEFVDNTMKIGTIDSTYGDPSALKVNFDFEGVVRTATMTSKDHFLMFATMREYNRDSLELCRGLYNWSMYVNIDCNYVKYK